MNTKLCPRELAQEIINKLIPFNTPRTATEINEQIGVVERGLIAAFHAGRSDAFKEIEDDKKHQLPDSQRKGY